MQSRGDYRYALQAGLDLCPEYIDIRVASIPAALIEESPEGAHSPDPYCHSADRE